jgi:hypothetical protein
MYPGDLGEAAVASSCGAEHVNVRVTASLEHIRDDATWWEEGDRPEHAGGSASRDAVEEPAGQPVGRAQLDGGEHVGCIPIVRAR